MDLFLESSLWFKNSHVLFHVSILDFENEYLLIAHNLVKVKLHLLDQVFEVHAANHFIDELSGFPQLKHNI